MKQSGGLSPQTGSLMPVFRCAVAALVLVALRAMPLSGQHKRPALQPVVLATTICAEAASLLAKPATLLGETSAYYDPAADTTFILTPQRQHNGRSILVTTRRPGRSPTPSPGANLVLMIGGGARELIHPYERPDERQLALLLDDSLRLTLGPMHLHPSRPDSGPMGDVNPRLTVFLGPASLLALVRADTAVAILGERSFPLSTDELADIRALYIQASCAPTTPSN